MAKDDDGMREAVSAFMVANQAVKEANLDEKLSPIQMVLLQFLALLKPGATPGEIGAEYEMDSAHCAKVLKTLKDGGYIHPVADAKDGRVKHYYNTLKGSRVASAALEKRGHAIPAEDLPHVVVSAPKIRGS
ncbi:MarR family winged helix-turn-helix transcriptional regulator [Methylorubrum zatmanii]|uniref:MarR family transcriptional regulator n=1 Tax=Methylorubrum zatmanii TaxID=29429 RepID=A0ABW1WR75_9HYPH|nr:MarR family winged helix-turn-helix transcriptional regulator [Methylorubrum zatmanii]